LSAIKTSIFPKSSIKCLCGMSVLFAVILLSASDSFSVPLLSIDGLAIPSSVIGSGGGTGESSEYNAYSVAGQSTPPGTAESTEYSIQQGHLYTVTPVTIETTSAPTLEWVKMNGIHFRSGDIISANAEMQAHFRDDQGVSTVHLVVDGVRTVLFELEQPGTTFEGTWKGKPLIHEPGVHILNFYAADGAVCAQYYPSMTARIKGGGVEMVGATYNYPNPFSPMSGQSTSIQYVLSEDATITLIIYDITGHEVKRMKFNAGAQGGRGGTNQVSWSGQSLGGETAGNGMYIYKIISGSQVLGSGKLVVFE